MKTWRELATDNSEESRVWIDDVLLQSLGIDVKLSSDEPMAPGLRNNSVPIPGMAGAHNMGAELDPRVFSYECVLPRGDTYADLKRLSRDFVALFYDQWGSPINVELRTGDEPEKWYTARISEGLSAELIAKRGVFTLVLTAYDPYAYAPMTYYDPDFVARYDAGTYYDDGITEYTNQTHTPFVNSRQYAGVFNYSHYATPFSFVIEGYVKNPKITNQTTGKSAELDVTVEADERLYFDSNLKTTWKINTKDDRWYWLTPNQMMKQYSEWEKINQYNALSGDIIYLASGDNSLLFEGEGPNAQINFNWLHRFL